MTVLRNRRPYGKQPGDTDKTLAGLVKDDIGIIVSNSTVKRARNEIRSNRSARAK
jgi:hypothetical protein